VPPFEVLKTFALESARNDVMAVLASTANMLYKVVVPMEVPPTLCQFIPPFVVRKTVALFPETQQVLLSGEEIVQNQAVVPVDSSTHCAFEVRIKIDEIKINTVVMMKKNLIIIIFINLFD